MKKIAEVGHLIVSTSAQTCNEDADYGLQHSASQFQKN